MDAHEALVEKVARCLAKHDCHDPDMVYGNDPPMWMHYIVPVRAALSVVAEALSKPTEEMVKAHVETEWPEGRDYPCAETAAWEWASVLSVSPLYPKKDGGNDQ